MCEKPTTDNAVAPRHSTMENLSDFSLYPALFHFVVSKLIKRERELKRNGREYCKKKKIKGLLDNIQMYLANALFH